MKKHIPYILTLLLTTFSMLVALPQLASILTETQRTNILTCYSHLLNGIGIIDYSNAKYPLTDKYGRRYTIHELDSLFPLLHFRQLMAEGRMPDSIEGQEATMRVIAAKIVNLRHSPSDKQYPACGLHLMYESMPIRVKFSLPNDVVSFADEVTFTDDTTITTNTHKSQLFTSAMRKAGFHFPVLASWGNDSSRKRYDEGLFCQDADSAIFHVKMVNGKPFVRKVPLPADLRAKVITTYEPSDRSFYGVIFSTDNRIALIETDEVETYKVRIFPDIRTDISKTTVTLNGNLLHWNLSVRDNHSQKCWAYNRNTFELIDTLSIPLYPMSESQRRAQCLFPYQIAGDPDGLGTVSLRLKGGPPVAWLINAILAATYFAFRGRKRRRRGILATALILFTGLCGAVAVALVPESLRTPQ